MAIEITVAICTYNRADLLCGALQSLCTQAVPVDCFEILVIDNGSTDNTTECVNQCQQQYPNYNIRIVLESRQGLGLARNTALQQAQGRYIAYLDDDARAEPDWLAQALAILKGQPEVIICLGGPIQPFYTTLKPIWFKDKYESRSWSTKLRWLTHGESFSGSNMIWRKTSLQTIGGFTDQVGVKGDILSLGEESNAFAKVWQQLEKPMLYYSPNLMVRHWVPAFKMKVSYRLKRAFMAGQVTTKLNRQPDQGWSMPSILKHIKGVLFQSIIALKQFGQYPFWQNWAIEAGEPIFSKLGMLLATMGIFIQVKQK